MADETGKEQSGGNWPIVKFSFSVKIGNTEGFFEEVTGLNADAEQVEYRGNDEPGFSAVKMPGIRKFGNVTLNKGIFKGDTALRDLYNKTRQGATERTTIVISLLDETQGVAMSWTLQNAYPLKMTAPDLKAEANETAVETMVLTHEGLAVG